MGSESRVQEHVGQSLLWMANLTCYDFAIVSIRNIINMFSIMRNVKQKLGLVFPTRSYVFRLNQIQSAGDRRNDCMNGYTMSACMHAT